MSCDPWLTVMETGHMIQSCRGTQVRDETFDEWHLAFINHLDMCFLYLKSESYFKVKETDLNQHVLI